MLAFGPIETPDSQVYIRQAAALLEYVRGDGAPAGYDAFKGTGFALVLLAFQRGFGEGWTWALVIVQTGLSIIASGLVAWLLFVLTNRPRLAAVLFVIHNLSLAMAVDSWILRDSLFSSTLTIVLVTIALFGVRRRRMSLLAAFGLGAALAFCFVLREQILFYGIFFLPLLLCGLHRGRSSWQRKAVIVILLIAPLLAARQGIVSLNESILGQDVVSTNARSVMLQALLEVAKDHPELFDGDTPLDRLARVELNDYTFAEVQVVKSKLVQEAGVPAPEAATMTIAKYFEAWQRFPAPLAHVVLNRFFDDQPKLLFSPGSSLMLHTFYVTGDTLYASSRRTLAQGLTSRDAGMVVLGAFQLAGEPVSILLYLLAWGGTVAMLYGVLTRRAILPEQSLLLWCLLAYAGLLLTHAMVHVEPRHVAGVIWAPQLVALITLSALMEFWRRRKAFAETQAGGPDQVGGSAGRRPPDDAAARR